MKSRSGLNRVANRAGWLTFGALAFAGVALAEPIRIVAFGDSNTYGMNMSREQSYPAQLEAMLKAKGYDVTVINAGIPGDTTSGALARVNSAVPTGTQIAIVTLGVNDARKGVSPASIEHNLSEILSNLKARNVRLIVCGRRAPFPPGLRQGRIQGRLFATAQEIRHRRLQLHGRRSAVGFSSGRAREPGGQHHYCAKHGEARRADAEGREKVAAQTPRRGLHRGAFACLVALTAKNETRTSRQRRAG